MFKNYLNTVLRGIWKHKILSGINIFGLATGITCCLLILLYVQFEYSFDRYHENQDRIHRITLNAVLAGNELNIAATPYPMAAVLENEFPEVEHAVRIQRFFQDALVSVDDLSYQEGEMFLADPSFFDIFTFPLLAGNAETALLEPNTIVVTESMANKYFPGSEALGKTLTVNNETDYLITGVIADIPANSHFHPDFIISFTSDPNHDSPIWLNNNMRTYVLVRPGTSEANFLEKLQELIPKYIAPQIEQVLGGTLEEFLATGGRYNYGLQALTDIHLFSDLDGEIEPGGSATYVYTFQAIAVFILLLACINFMNLSTARSSNRAKEIGVRKVLGAYQGQLVGQFLIESILISLLALLIALPLVALLLPPFSAVMDREMSASVLFSPSSLSYLVAGAIFVGTLSGSYPAFFLSKFHPQEVLKGKLSSGGKNSWLRGSLVVFQFVISITLVASTLIVYTQLDYLRSKPLGFEKEQLLIIHRAGGLGEQLESFKTQIAQQANIESVTSAADVPGDLSGQNVYLIEGRPAADSHILSTIGVNYDFIETMGMEIVSGRGFSREFPSDGSALLINETAAREMALEQPTETTLIAPNPEGNVSGPVIGVVKDFHWESLHQEIRPMVIRVSSFPGYILVRIQADNVPQTIATLEDTWSTMTGGEPFEYTFADEDFDNFHQQDQRLGEIFIGFSALAILIACLGLYGLASFTTEQRTKEIGVRKTLGATVSNIVLLMSRESIVLVFAALVIAVPIAYLTMNTWLQMFSYRASISSVSFIASGILALIIAFLTVSSQSVRTALKNPTLTLRDE